MSTEIIIALIGILATGVSSFLTWLFARKKYNAEVDSQVIQNMNNLLDFYIKLCDDTNRRVLEIQRENDSLREKVEKIETRLVRLQGKACYRERCQDRVFDDRQPNKTAKKNAAKSIEKVEKE